MSSPRPITLRAGELLLEVVAAGAAVRRLAAVEDGEAVDLVLGHADPATYETAGGYLGATIGRVANRIDGGRFTLDGTDHRLSTNQYGNTLHGGVRGFDAHEWSVADTGEDHVTFTLSSADGDQGFPGRLDTAVTYTVAPGEVAIDYVARTDAPTVVNLTNHSYFQLDGAGSGPIDGHRLEVAAEAILPLREDLVPTGEVRPVAGTPFDLRRGPRIGDALGHGDDQLRIAGGIDHNYVLGGSGLRRAARLVGASGRWLEVDTDQPGLQVYTGAHFDGTITGLDGSTYGPRAGIALETQGFPDAPNHPEFPGVVLRPGEELRSRTAWRLGREER